MKGVSPTQFIGGIVAVQSSKMAATFIEPKYIATVKILKPMQVLFLLNISIH